MQLPVLLEQFFKDQPVAPPCSLTTIELSSNLSLSIEIDPYTEFENNNCTYPENIRHKLTFRYCFPQLKESQIIIPPSIKRKKIEFRESLILNAFKYTYVKVNVDSFLTFCKTLPMHEQPGY